MKQHTLITIKWHTYDSLTTPTLCVWNSTQRLGNAKDTKFMIYWGAKVIDTNIILYGYEPHHTTPHLISIICEFIRLVFYWIFFSSHKWIEELCEIS